jgi:alkylation response protein AidB-like acyl-CoA dehydrogenase
VTVIAPEQRPTLAEFVEECRTFFAKFPVKAERTGPFRWGEGDDRVAVFESPDRDLQAIEIAKLRAYRRQVFDAGLGWITGPVSFGGRELPNSYQRAFDTESRNVDVPSGSPLTISLGMVGPTVLAHATPAAKQRLLPALYAGDLIACQLFSEPGAGSDLPSMTTRAIRDGDGWRVNGQKVWTSGAHVSDIGLLICRTGDGPRHHNLTAFIIDMHQPGVEVRPLRQMTGGAAFNEVFFEDAWVPDDDRLGEVDAGWRVVITTLSNERGAVGGSGFGGVGILNMDRYRIMVQEMGRADDPVIRNAFAELYSHVWTAKMTQQRASDARRAGASPGPEGSIGKLALSNNFQRVSAFVSAVLGPALVADNGAWGTYAWSELVLGTPGYRVGGGTDEILKNTLAERVLGLPKEP